MLIYNTCIGADVLNTAKINDTQTFFSFVGDSSVQHLEKNNLAIFHWGNIQNSPEIGRLLESEAGIKTANFTTTELLYEAYQHWGMGLLNHIQGACSLVLYDSAKDLIFMAIDKLGLSQIYYTFIDGTYYFANNLLSVTKQIQTPSLQETLIQYYIASGITPMHETLIENVYKIPPATWIQIKNEDIKTHTYWYPVNNSYLIQESDIPSFSSALQAVENKLGDMNYQPPKITPKLLFNSLIEEQISAPIANLTDFISPTMKIFENIFVSNIKTTIWQKLLPVINKNNKPQFTPATISEHEISDLISPIIKEKQFVISKTLDTLYDDFKSQPQQKQTESNWMRTVNLTLSMPNNITENEVNITSDLVELMIGLPEKTSLKISQQLITPPKKNHQPLEEWFFNRYKKESYDIVINLCEETGILDTEKVTTAWEKQNLKLNWRLTSLALWWQQSIKKEATFLK